MKITNLILNYLCISCFVFINAGKLTAQNVPVNTPVWVEELGCWIEDPNTGKSIHLDRYGQTNLTYNGITYHCDCDNGCRPVTTNSSPSSSSNSGYSSSGYKPYSSQDFKTQMMTTIADYAITSFFNWLNTPSKPSKTVQQQQQQQQQIQQQKIADEKAKKEALARWTQMQSTEDLKRKEDQAEKIRKGEAILQQIQTFSSNNNSEPFSINDPRLDITPLPEKTYPNKGLDHMDRLMCASYFSNLASQSNKDVEAAFYNEQVELVMAGQPTYVECKLPAKASNMEIEKRIEETKQLLTVFNEKVNELETIEKEEVQLTELVKETKDKKQTIKKELERIKEEAVVAEPEKKEEMDELIRMAQEQFDEAENSAIKAETKQKEILEKKEKTIEELKEYQTKIKPPVQPISIPSTK
jgi:hypothetical protein